MHVASTPARAHVRPFTSVAGAPFSRLALGVPLESRLEPGCTQHFVCDVPLRLFGPGRALSVELERESGDPVLMGSRDHVPTCDPLRVPIVDAHAWDERAFEQSLELHALTFALGDSSDRDDERARWDACGELVGGEQHESAWVGPSTPPSAYCALPIASASACRSFVVGVFNLSGARPEPCRFVLRAQLDGEEGGAGDVGSGGPPAARVDVRARSPRSARGAQRRAWMVAQPGAQRDAGGRRASRLRALAHPRHPVESIARLALADDAHRRAHGDARDPATARAPRVALDAALRSLLHAHERLKLRFLSHSLLAALRLADTLRAAAALGAWAAAVRATHAAPSARRSDRPLVAAHGAIHSPVREVLHAWRERAAAEIAERAARRSLGASRIAAALRSLSLIHI